MRYVFTSLVLLLLSPLAHADSSYGEMTYKTYCAGCHGVEGKGNGDASSFAENKAILAKSDEELVNSIIKGKNNMPAYEWMMNQEQAEEIVKYIREEFGE